MSRSGFVPLGRWQGAPIRMHWSTPLGALLLSGFRWAPVHWLAVFLLILLHELGHGLMVQRAGAEVVSIDMMAVGGLCRWAGNVSAIQRARISWGGVMAQLAVLGIALLAEDVQGPPASGARPGALVIHGGAGLDAHARAQAERLARLGLTAFACDMFGPGVIGDRERVIARIQSLRSNREMLCARAAAGLDVLLRHSRCDGRTLVIGFCFGGFAALELARSGAAIAGAISVHGSLETTRPAEPGAIKARVLVVHGARDPFVPPAHVAAFIEEMNRADVDFQLLALGRAEHGFTHEGAPPRPGVSFDGLADARAMQAIHAFQRELFPTGI